MSSYMAHMLTEELKRDFDHVLVKKRVDPFTHRVILAVTVHSRTYEIDGPPDMDTEAFRAKARAFVRVMESAGLTIHRKIAYPGGRYA